MANRRKDKKVKFSESEIADFKLAFDLFDVRHEGQISTKDLGRVMKSLGEESNPHELRQMIREIDQDGNGLIDFDEFTYLMTKVKKDVEDTSSELKDVFHQFDVNGDGYITVDDLKAVMAKVKEKATDAEIQQMIRIADKKGKGKVDLKSFLEFVGKK